MKTDDVALEECVVVGYGTMKTKAMSGAYVAVCPTAMYDMDTRMNTEEYDRIQENGFKSVADTPLSTFLLMWTLLLIAICVVLSIEENCLLPMQSVRKN